MIKEVIDKCCANNCREVTFRYHPNDKNDIALLDKIMNILLTEQPLCTNCKNLIQEGYFCGYTAHRCKIHGNIEEADHPHYDGDGSKCKDYFPKWHLEEAE